MSGFPSGLQIGEGATPNELDLDQPATSNQFLRYRDRDEYLKSILSDGAAAPEDLTIKGITIGGAPLWTPGSYGAAGLSAANGSYSLSGDFFAWITGVWANMIVLPFTVANPTYGMLVANMGYFKSYPYGAAIQYRIVIDNVEHARVDLTNDWHQGAAVDFWQTGLSWAGYLAAGAHWVALQQLQPFSIGWWGRAWHQVDQAPSVRVVIA